MQFEIYSKTARLAKPHEVQPLCSQRATFGVMIPEEGDDVSFFIEEEKLDQLSSWTAQLSATPFTRPDEWTEAFDLLSETMAFVERTSRTDDNDQEAHEKWREWQGLGARIEAVLADAQALRERLQRSEQMRGEAAELGLCAASFLHRCGDLPTLPVHLVTRASYLAANGAPGTMLALDDLDRAWAADRHTVPIPFLAEVLSKFPPAQLRYLVEKRKDGVVKRLAVEKVRVHEATIKQQKSAAAAAAAEQARVLASYRSPEMTSPQVELQQSGEWHGRFALNMCAERPKEPSEPVALSVELLRQLVKIFRKYSAAEGVVESAQLAAIGASDAFASFVLDTARLRNLQFSLFDDEHRFAFWINCYNMCIMHGCVACATRMQKKLDALRVLRLHSGWFCYEIAGHTYSCIQIEHAVLRGGRPRPAFIGNNFLIPKFWPSDPRRPLCPTSQHSPWLMFALVPGTAFSPPLRVYHCSSPVHKQLEENARRFLQSTAHVIDMVDDYVDSAPPPSVVLPIQLQWHQQDLSKSGTEMLRLLDPLLSTSQAEKIREVVDPTSPYPASIQYTPYRWAVVFKVKHVH
ncbi:MAG: hypothetical protein SGPRY_015098 [Prymnesium sp.]